MRTGWMRTQDENGNDVPFAPQTLAQYVQMNGGQSLEDMMFHFWPIGSIYSSLPNESPSKYFGGTWIRWGTSTSPYMWQRIQPPSLDIEMETGLLKQTKADGYTGPVYRLDANGNLVLEG